MALERDFVKEIIDLVTSLDDLHELKSRLDEYHPNDIALALEGLDYNNRLKIYRAFDSKELALIFSFLDDSNTYFEEINPNHAASIINEMPEDDAARLIDSIPNDVASEIMNLVDDDTREDIEELNSYSDKEAGSIMTTSYMEINANDDVKQAMKNVVLKAPEHESFNTLFAVDDKGILQGVLDLKRLIVTKSPCLIKEIMNDNFQYANVHDDLEDTLETIKNYDIYALPVIDDEHILRGIITMDDALDTLINETSDDYAKLSGLTSEENHYEGTITSIKKRLPWLLILLCLDLLVIIVMSFFDTTISRFIVLVSFQPVILGLSGNTGTQALAVTVRKISQNELENKKSIFKHLFKEFRIGLLAGALLGVFSFVTSLLFLLLQGDTEEIIQFSMIVGVSILVVMTFATLLGALIPIGFNALHIDPAVASGPFITTINDMLAVFIYYGLATLLFIFHII